MNPQEAIFRELFESCRSIAPTFDYLPESNDKLPFIYLGESSNTKRANDDLIGWVRQTVHIYGKRIDRKKVNDFIAKISDKAHLLTGKHGGGR